MTTSRCERRLLWAPAALMLLAGCGADAQDVPGNATSVPAGGAAPGNAAVEAFLDAGPRLTLDDKLKAMGPDGWHRLALYANWDFTDEAVWRWIISQPDCDRATALAIFWKASPEYYLEFRDRAAVPTEDRQGYDLLTSIRDRWVAGGYKRSELAFDLAHDVAPVEFAALERRFGEHVAKWIPPSMRISIDGRRIENVGDPLPGVYGSAPVSGSSM